MGLEFLRTSSCLFMINEMYAGQYICMDPMALYHQHICGAILVSRDVVFGHQEVANRRDNSTQIDLICRLVLNLNMDPLKRTIAFGHHCF